MKNMNTSTRSFYLLTLSAAMLTACIGKDDGVKPTVKPLIEAVYASGFVVSKDEYEIFPQVEGSVAEKLVEEGDAVKKGEPLYIIESGQQSARYSIARENYDLASKNFRDNSPVLQELKAARESAK